jgi:hypothetical protein
MGLVMAISLPMGAWGQAGERGPERQLMSYLQAQHRHWQRCGADISTYQRQWLTYLADKAPAPTPLRLPDPPRAAEDWNWSAAAPAYQGDLAQKSAAYARLVTQVQSLFVRIGPLSEQAPHDQEAHRAILDALRRLQLLTEDARSLQGELVFLAQQSHRAGLAAHRSAQAALAEQVEALVVHSRVLLLAVGTDLRPRIERAHQQLTQSLSQAQARGATLLAQLDHDPRLSALYDQALRQATTIATAALEPLTPDELSAELRPWGVAHARFNHFLNPAFSTEPDGLVATYNALLTHLSEARYLPALSELPRMQTVVPAPVAENPTLDLTFAPVQNLVCLIDVSGSMQLPHGLPLFRSAYRELVEALRPQDHVSLVTFAGEARTVLHATSGTEKAHLLGALEHLDGQGKTRIHAGFMAGYRELRRHWSEEGSNHLLLITDGGFDITEALVRDIEARTAQGAVLTVLYFGPPSARMQYRLQRLGEVGGGTCLHVEPGNATHRLIEAIEVKPGNLTR